MPFALSSWSQVGQLPSIGAGLVVTAQGPCSVAYNPDRNIILTGRTGAGAALGFVTGDFCRSVDNGATWSQLFVDEGDGRVHAPICVTYLRDPTTGQGRFIAIVMSVTFVFTSLDTVRLRVYVSDDKGFSWTPGQILTLQTGGGAVGAVVSQIVTRSHLHPADPLEHYIFIKANAASGTTRGLYRSTDMGATWSFVSDPGDFSPGLTVAGRTLLSANLAALLGVAKSEDGGFTWRPAVVPPFFPASSILAFGGGPAVACKGDALTTPEVTLVSCDNGNSWPPGQVGPSFGLPEGSLNTFPSIIYLSQWECLFAAADDGPLGTIEIVYSDNGGETEAARARINNGTGIVAHVLGGTKLADGRPIVIAGADQSRVYRSSDVPTGQLGTRIYCLLAPAPGVGFVDFTPACGPFYNPCPQECPADVAQPAGLMLTPPPPVILGEAPPLGDLELVLGEPLAIIGGEPNTPNPYALLGKPAGCGNTFINEPCAAEACP